MTTDYHINWYLKIMIKVNISCTTQIKILELPYQDHVCFENLQFNKLKSKFDAKMKKKKKKKNSY